MKYYYENNICFGIALQYRIILLVISANQLSPGDGHWGDWTKWSHCPDNSFVNAFRLRIMPYRGVFKDDSGLNSIELKCVDVNRNTTR